MKKIFTLIALLTGMQVMAVAQLPWLHTEGNKIKDPAGKTVILRGLDTQDIGELYQQGNLFKVLTLITNKKDSASESPGWYTDVVRLAVDPIGGDFETYYKNVMKPAVDTLTKLGVYVIIDNHFIEDVQSNVEYTNKFWKFFAPKFKDYSNVMFEVYNEPVNFSMSWKQFRDGYMQPWVDLIRNYAPHNLILAGCPIYSQEIGESDIYPLKGENILYVAHIYPLHYKNANNRQKVERAAKVNPVIITEWGFSNTVSSGSMNLLGGTITGYGKPIVDWMNGMGLSWTAWCADDDWEPAMFTRGTWGLKTGEGEMGGYVKDLLYQYRDSNKAVYSECKVPFLGGDISLCGKSSVDISSLVTKEGVTFSWYKNDTLIAAETDSILKNISAAGVYKVKVVYNNCRMTDEVNVMKTLFPVDLGPDLYLTKPVTLVAGESDPVFQYKWYKNDQLIEGASSNKLEVFEKCNNKFHVEVSTSDCQVKADTFRVVCRRGMFLGKPIEIPGLMEAEYYDFQNEDDLAYSDSEVANKGGKLRDGGVDVEACLDENGGYNVGWIEGNEWMEYTVKVARDGIYAVNLRVASNGAQASGNGIITITTTNYRPVVSEFEVPFTGGWQNWETVYAGKAELKTTDTLIRIYFNHGSFNLNYLEFSDVTATKDKKESASFIIYPNPAENVLVIQSEDELQNWSVTSLTGIEVISGIGSTVDISTLQPGYYLLSSKGITRSFIKK
jgi:endoglucanase